MTLPNRLQLELNEIVAAAAATSTGQEMLEGIDVEHARLVFFDSFGVSDSVRIGGPSHAVSVMLSSIHVTHPAVNLSTEIEQLKVRVAALEEEVARLKGSLADGEVIELRTISKEEAKQEILDLFQSGETLFYSDLAGRLRIDLPLVVEICEELKKGGEIEVDANAI